MASCWTCGSRLDRFGYDCPSCRDLEHLQRLRSDLDSYAGSIAERLQRMGELQDAGFAQLAERMQTSHDALASALEWGFSETSWRLELQTDTLRDIHDTLRRPRRTKARELRDMGEELGRRGELAQASSSLENALKLNPLDFWAYLALAEIYLKRSMPREARNVLESSLPHAPSSRLQWASHVHRLIARIQASEGHSALALTSLSLALEFEPQYAPAHYDRAEYLARVGRPDESLAALKTSILIRPGYLLRARADAALKSLGIPLGDLLNMMVREAANAAASDIRNAQQFVSEAEEFLATSGVYLEASPPHAAAAVEQLRQARTRLEALKAAFRARDYVECVGSPAITKDIVRIASEVRVRAKRDVDERQQRFVQERAARQREAEEQRHNNAVGGAMAGFMIGALIGGCSSRPNAEGLAAMFGLGVLGAVIGAGVAYASHADS